ncbi:MAG: recombination protein RecR [Phycisphaerales bacterium]|nr:recombination protein RecR [Phycisphaerales bacterium]
MDRSGPYPDSMVRLIDEFANLPGIGRRSAERLAFHVLKSDRATAMKLAQAISDVKTHVKHCSICYNLADRDPCPICSDPRREHQTVLVVEQPKDLISLEQTGMYRGGYHVLLGHIAPLDGIEPEDLTVGALLKRVDDPAGNACGVRIAEVIFGLSPNLEGDGTALYLAEQLKSRGVKLSRLARGLPSGSQIEYASKAVLADAIIGRQGVE